MESPIRFLQEERHSHFLRKETQEGVGHSEGSLALPGFSQLNDCRRGHDKGSETERGRRQTAKARGIWKAAQQMIISVGLDPSEWFYSHLAFYDYFYQKQFSVRYAHAILAVANLWGFFYSRKLARPFLAVPRPRGYERQRILDAYYGKTEKSRKASAPLAPELLAATRGRLNLRNFNWLYLSIWLGLRPQEIDNLHDPNLWHVATLSTARKVLSVFQTKLVALPPEDRWKSIPLLFDEQQFALRIIESGTFRRPLVRTIHKYFGPHTTLYGGRKGFCDLMISRGQILENISIWMGHTSLGRTWRSYKSKRLFHIHELGSNH